MLALVGELGLLQALQQQQLQQQVAAVARPTPPLPGATSLAAAAARLPGEQPAWPRWSRQVAGGVVGSIAAKPVAAGDPYSGPFSQQATCAAAVPAWGEVLALDGAPSLASGSTVVAATGGSGLLQPSADSFRPLPSHLSAHLP